VSAGAAQSAALSRSDYNSFLKKLKSDILRVTNSAATTETRLKECTEISSDDASQAKKSIEVHVDNLCSVVFERKSLLLKEIGSVADKKRSALEAQAVSLRQFLTLSGSLVSQASTISSSLGDGACWDAVGAGMSAAELAIAAVPASFGCITDSNIHISMDPVSDIRISSEGLLESPGRVRTFVAHKECSVIWDGHENLLAQYSVESYDVKLQVISGPSGWFATLSAGGLWMPPDTNGCTDVLERVIGSVESRSGSAKGEYAFKFPIEALAGHVIKCFVRSRLVSNFNKSHEKTVWAPQVNSPVHVPALFDCVTLSPGPHPFMGLDLFSFIGTRSNSHPYINPCLAGEVEVTWSSVGGGALSQFVARDKGTDFCYTKDEPGSWMMVDLGESRTFLPTAYSLRHDMQGSRGVLRNWVLQACHSPPSTTGQDAGWITLSSHRNDTSLAPAPGSCAIFDINVARDDSRGYRFFRILQNGKNSTGKHRLMCAGFELFGNLYEHK
jgi:hypothetical protein